MIRIADDLYETETESPFPGLTTHAYLWTTADGNVLVYNTSHRHELDRIAELGGVAHQYLSHRDEASSSLAVIRSRFGSTLHVPAVEHDEIGAHAVADATFEHRATDRIGAATTLEVLPTPGHSPGSTCFVVRLADGRTCLFTGDTVYVGRDGRWTAGHVPGVSDAAAMERSITTLRAVRPDVVASSAFAGERGVHTIDPATWPACIDDAVASLRALTDAEH